MDNRPYHMFLAKLDGRSHRISSLIDDSAFGCLMDMLHWKMPYQLRAFHCNTPEWAAKNPVLKTIPELPMDIGSLLSALPLQPMRLKDKRRQQTLTVRNKYGSYVLADTEDGYGRLYHVDGITSSLITRLEAVPITLRRPAPTSTAITGITPGRSFTSFPSVCAFPESRSLWASPLQESPRPAIRWTARRWRSTAAVLTLVMRTCAVASMPGLSASVASWDTTAS